MTEKFLPVFASAVSNEVVSFLPVNTDTFPGVLIQVNGIQKLPVTLMNGNETSIGSVIIERHLPSGRDYYVIRSSNADDVSISQGTINSMVPNSEIIYAGNWVETGFAGQMKIETHFEDDFKKYFVYIN